MSSSIGNKGIMARNLRYYTERSGKTQKELAMIVGVAASTFNEWLKGRKYPRIDKIEILADYFGILKSDLIEDKSTDCKRLHEHNNGVAEIIVRMRTDEDFLNVVKSAYELDSRTLSNLAAFLSKE